MSETTTPALVRIRNASPRAALEVPLLRGRIVKRGQVIEVSAAHAAILTRQAIWEPVPSEDAPPTKGDTKDTWVDYAQALGIDTTELTKDQIIAAVDVAHQDKEKS